MGKTKIYVTTMYKFGDRNSYSYVFYAGLSAEDAVSAGEEEVKNRRGSYDYEVVELILGVNRITKVLTKNVV